MSENNTESDAKDAPCPHYKRRCAFISPCCDKEYPCRLCHDEKELHVLNRHAVQQVKCIRCNTKQQAEKECQNCGVSFGNYFCKICRLYDDTPRKQFHCEGCGICRIGGRENFFHCKRCDMCLGIDLKDKHKCVEKVSRANCPVCMEDLHTSTTSLHVPKCQHLIHRDCYIQLLKSGNYTCPTCNVSLEKMDEYWRTLDHEIAQTPMPEEYRDQKVGVLCRDCHKESQTLFHIIGLKCQHCGSYNTCGTDLPEEATGAVGTGGGQVDQVEVDGEAEEHTSDAENTDTNNTSGNTQENDTSQEDMPLD